MTDAPGDSRTRKAASMGKGLTALGLLVAAVAIVGIVFTTWLTNPVKAEADRAYRAQVDAITVAEKAAAAQRNAEFWQGVQPWLMGATIALALTCAGGLGLAALSFGLTKWDERQKARKTYQADQRGLYSVSEGARDAAAAASLAGYWQAEIERSKLPPPPAEVRTYAPRFITQERTAPALTNRPAVELPAPQAAPMLPGAVSLSSVLTWRPSLDRILIGLDAHGQPLTVTAKDLVHVALVGSTGAGKSNSLRLITSQLLAAGAKVVLGDPHYSPKDADDDLTGDWRPIEAKLYRPPAVLPAELASLFDWLGDELTNRLARRRRGEHSGPPMFCAFDELPVIMSKADNAADTLTAILREGRKVNLFCITSTQDMLTRTLGTGGAVRDQFRTAIYGGGDVHSASVLLDMPRRAIDDAGLGKGTVLLRSAATPQAGLARLPLVLDSDLHRLLPRPTEASRPRPVSDFDRQPAPEVAEVGEVARSGRVLTFPSVQNEAREVGEVAEVGRSSEVDDRDASAIDLMRGTADTPPMSMTSAIATVFGVKGGEAFQRHAARLRARMLNGTGTDGD